MRTSRYTWSERFTLLALVGPLLGMALPVALMSGCAALDGLRSENPPETTADLIGDAESRIAAVSRATTRASQAGSLTLDEVIDIREQIGQAEEIVTEATTLLEAGETREAENEVDRAEAVLNVLQRRLREVAPDE